jgi:hypothetical protein
MPQIATSWGTIRGHTAEPVAMLVTRAGQSKLAGSRRCRRSGAGTGVLAAEDLGGYLGDPAA